MDPSNNELKYSDCAAKITLYKEKLHDIYVAHNYVHVPWKLTLLCISDCFIEYKIELFDTLLNNTCELEDA